MLWFFRKGRLIHEANSGARLDEQAGHGHGLRGISMTQTRPPLEVRDRHHNFDDSILKYFDSGNGVLTHEWNALSLIIPPGERYFIRCVQSLVSRVKDPVLKLQIKGFIGQEAMHSKETNRMLESLEREGFPVGQFQGMFERFIFFLERWLPFRAGHLATTAAVEHYTAIFSIWHLENRYCDRFPAPIRELYQWHGAEELEHKAVAFDLLQDISRHSYLWRIIGFVFGMGMTWFGYRKALRMLLKWEGLSRAQIRVERKRARGVRIPLLSWSFPHLWDFLRPKFHPNDLDDGHLGKQVLAEQDVREGVS